MRTTRSAPELFQHVGRHVALVTAFANLDGAVFVFVYTEFIAPTERSTTSTGYVNDVSLFVVFMIVSMVFMWRSIDRLLCDTLGWIAEDRAPSDEERATTLGLPFQIAIRPMAMWTIAAFVFSGLSLVYGHTWGWAIEVIGTTMLGGVLSCAISFLVLERVSRPVFALALAGKPPERSYTIGVRPRLLLTWLLGSAVPLLILALLPFDAQHADERTNIAGAVVAIAVAGLALGLITTIVAAMSVADPLQEVRNALARVQQGDLSVEVPVNDGGEVGLLQSGVNEMVAGLRERQRLADLFGRHVGTEVAQQAIDQGSGVESEQREASVLFVDLIGSTALAEDRPATQPKAATTIARLPLPSPLPLPPPLPLPLRPRARPIAEWCGDRCPEYWRPGSCCDPCVRAPARCNGVAAPPIPASRRGLRPSGRRRVQQSAPADHPAR